MSFFSCQNNNFCYYFHHLNVVVVINLGEFSKMARRLLDCSQQSVLLLLKGAEISASFGSTESQWCQPVSAQRSPLRRTKEGIIFLYSWRECMVLEVLLLPPLLVDDPQHRSSVSCSPDTTTYLLTSLHHHHRTRCSSSRWNFLISCF